MYNKDTLSDWYIVSYQVGGICILFLWRSAPLKPEFAKPKSVFLSCFCQLVIFENRRTTVKLQFDIMFPDMVWIRTDAC